MATLPRGIRNHNPGNIEFNKRVKWRGQIGTDGRFIKFKSPEYGIRAIVRVLKTYQNKYHINTVQAMIQRWAPPSENATSAYITAVAHRIGVAATQKIDINDAHVAHEMVVAIISVENGGKYANYYPEEVINRGLGLAGIIVKSAPKAAQELVVSKRSGASIVGASVTITGATNALAEVNKALAQVEQVSAKTGKIVTQLQDVKQLIWLLTAFAIGAFAVIIWTKWHDVRRGR